MLPFMRLFQSVSISMNVQVTNPTIESVGSICRDTAKRIVNLTVEFFTRVATVDIVL